MESLSDKSEGEIFEKSTRTRSMQNLQDERNQAFPSDAQLMTLFTEICGGRHPGHPYDRESCYLYYVSKCKPNCFLAQIPGKNRLPLSPSILTDRASIADHVTAILEAQSPIDAGGSFKPFLSDSIRLIKSNRQISFENDDTEVITLVYGISPVQEVKDFVQSFNREMERYQSPEFGSYPQHFYHFDVLYCRTYEGFSPRVFSNHRDEGKIIGQPMEDLPARIVFGFWDKRWEIVFNFTYTDMNPHTYEADFCLFMRETRLQDVWFKLFSQLHGFAVSLDLTEKLEKLFNFIAEIFTFRNCTGIPHLKSIDVGVLLAISGWNYPTLNSVSLAFMFTGGMLVKPWQLVYGFGLWTEEFLPRSLNMYLKSECFAILNATLICSISWMLHWFVTPGLAALVSKKDPEKFLTWMALFQVEILKNAYLSIKVPFLVSSSTSIMSAISYKSGAEPLLLPEQLAILIPTWDHVTGKNCPTDIFALDHLFFKLHPLVNLPSIPKHLRLESCKDVIFPALTGKNIPISCGIQTKESKGCVADKLLLSIPEIIVKLEEDSCEFTLAHVYKIFRNNHISKDDLAKELTPLQLSILYAWLYPREFVNLYLDSFERNEKFRWFLPPELCILKPLVCAYLGRPVADPPCLRSFKMNRFSAKDVSRFAVAQELADSDNLVTRRKARRRMRILARKQKVSVTIMQSRVEESFPRSPVRAVLYSPSSPTRDETDCCFTPPPSDELACSSDIELEIDPIEMDAILRSSP